MSFLRDNMKIIKIAREITLEMVKDPNCPPEILSKASEREGDNYISLAAVSNPNCPSEALAKVLEREKVDWVSLNAVNNPNCPPEYIWLWKNMRYDSLGFLNYLESSPEIQNNSKITQLVKKELIKFLNNRIKTLLFRSNNIVKSNIKKLIDKFADDDFIVSLYQGKIK